MTDETFAEKNKLSLIEILIIATILLAIGLIIFYVIPVLVRSGY